jgi:hypothetical protein
MAPVIGVVGYRPAVVARLDPRTLRPLPGARIRLPHGISGYGWTPDRSLLVLGPRRRRAARDRPGPAAPGGHMVLLSTSVDRIGPARLQVVDDRGRVRTAELEGVDAGFQNPPDRDSPAPTASPGRPPWPSTPTAGGRSWSPPAPSSPRSAWTASRSPTEACGSRSRCCGGSPLARPPAEAKLNAGTWRAACWLGDGRLAVWGSESRGLGDDPAEQRFEQRPSGLKLIDTRTWTVRTLHPTATDASWQGGRLLAFGSTWDHETKREVGVGLTLYTGAEEWAGRVVSLASGQVVASERPLPWLLLGEDNRPC